MSRIYNSAALTDFVEQIEVAKSQRTLTIEQIIRSFPGALLQIEEIETQINDRIRQLQEPSVRRPRARRRLIVSWENVGPRGDVLSAPRGPSWFIADKQKNIPQRINQPTAETLRRIYRAEFYQTSRQLRDEVKKLSASREKLLKYLSSAHRSIRAVAKSAREEDTAPPMENLFDRGIPRSMPEHLTTALLARRSTVETLVCNFRAALEASTSKEGEIETRMIEFNRLGRKNRNIMVRWELAKNLDTTVAGVLGPYWFKVFKNRDARHKKRLTKDTSINRELLRASWQGRKSKDLLEYAGKINELSRERSDIIAVFTAVKKEYTHLVKKELI